MRYEFVRVAAAVPEVHLADCMANAEEITKLILEADKAGVEIISFPELCITGYCCQDLFESDLILNEAERALAEIAEATKDASTISIVGLPLRIGSSLANCAAVIEKGKILAAVPKTYLPNYKEFYEKRWFASASELTKDTVTLNGLAVPVNTNFIFRNKSVSFAIEICEDLWAPIPRSSHLALDGAEIIFNLSADNELTGKHQYVRSLVAGQSARSICAYVFSSCGWGESTQDLVFAGKTIVAENGKILIDRHRFFTSSGYETVDIDIQSIRHDRRVNTTFRQSAAEENDRNTDIYLHNFTEERRVTDLARYIDPTPFVPSDDIYESRLEEILNIQSYGLARRLDHIHCKTAVIGISGGLDSTLALLVTARAFDILGLSRLGIYGITMPGFGTSDMTHTNALDLMEELCVTSREIPIREACTTHFKDIGQDTNTYDITYENSQARERTQILMDYANKVGGIVIGTGDLSELALGWATYNGDHMSMYGVNCSIPKTLVRHLIIRIAEAEKNERTRETLKKIIDTPISPELIPTDKDGNITQITEDKVGPYVLHDFFLYYTLRFGFSPARIFYLACHAFRDGKYKYDKSTIKYWMKIFFRRFFSQQFKRSCLPDGPKVGSCSLSPRGDWRMPSDADASAWLKECDEL